MNPFNNARYELLALQFKVPSQNSNLLNKRQKKRLIGSLITYTTIPDIFYLELLTKKFSTHTLNLCVQTTPAK